MRVRVVGPRGILIFCGDRMIRICISSLRRIWSLFLLLTAFCTLTSVKRRYSPQSLIADIMAHLTASLANWTQANTVESDDDGGLHKMGKERAAHRPLMKSGSKIRRKGHSIKRLSDSPSLFFFITAKSGFKNPIVSFTINCPPRVIKEFISITH